MPTDYDKIREENILEYGQGTRHLSFLGRLYTDRTHFVFELLQNAEDAGATRILFNLYNDRLEVSHDGRPFDQRDVRGVCGVGEGTKVEDLTQIGKFGIGFKSVYAYTATPEVHSGDEGFRIENYVRPYSLPSKPAGHSWTTLFVFPFNTEEITPETACKEIGARLRNLSARTLLFLRSISEIEYRLPNSIGGVYLREEIKRGPARKVRVTGQNNGYDEEENWLIFERSVAVPGESETVRVEVSFRIYAEDEAGEKVDRIVKVKDSPLVVYFPTEKATRFGFLIQGPYRTTPSRDNIPKDDEWNETLVKETAELIGDVLLAIKGLGLLSVSFLEALPIRTEDFPIGSMFYPIVASVRKVLMKEELLPADDGSFVSAGNAKLASADWLRKLIQHEQMNLLFQKEPKWIQSDITERGRHELWKYMKEELEIDEVTPDSFARKVDSTFFKNQSDQWMIDFYAQLLNQKALWKKAYRSYSENDGPLRKKPFIRLQDGTQVTPFLEDGSPSSYLIDDIATKTSLQTVKIEISQNENACKFLKELGIPELDHVAEVIETILPKYKKDMMTITCDEHKHDIAAIEKAYTTDSQEKKDRLRECLLETPFIRTECNHNGDNCYNYIDKLYFANDNLELYFSGNESVGFVWSEYSQGTKDLLKSLGLADSVRVRRKLPNKQGIVKIKDSHGDHKRGLKGFDLNIHVDGLKEAITLLTPEKSLFIWNQIAIPNAACIRGVVEKASRQTFEYSEKENSISDFGNLLIEAEWLPDSKGRFHKPCNIELNQLPETFIRDERLASQLGMKLDVVSKLAEEVGVKPEILEYVRKNPLEIEKLIARDVTCKERPTFPKRPVTNQERRQERVGEQLSNAPVKEYEKRERSVRTTNGTIDPTTWLRNQYTNEADQMVCQICKEEMPFRKRNGEHYFQKKEVLSKKYLPKEHEAQYLALCPICAAKYEEFVKSEDNVMAEVKKAILSAEGYDVPISLGEQEASIRFVETHYHDLKTIVGGLE